MTTKNKIIPFVDFLFCEPMNASHTSELLCGVRQISNSVILWVPDGPKWTDS
jgi:hypothetical protein